MPTTHLLYLHGFRSSPLSTKAQMMRKRIDALPQVTWCCPQLPASPRQALEQVEHRIRDWPRASMAVAGSSLGGFYAGLIAERTGCRAVLLNPVVAPARDLGSQVGEQSTWQNPQERFDFLPDHLEELRQLEQAGRFTDPARYYTLIAKGDELLDWREMTARYPAAHGRLLEASDHALSDFDAHIDDVIAFLELAA